MGGPAIFSGAEAQADIGAFIAVYALARWPLRWVELSVADVPIAVSCETGGPGDDVGIDILGSTTRIEVQSKRGLTRGKPLTEALQHIARRLPADPSARVVLAVDPSTSDAIRLTLRADLRRLGQGRSECSTLLRVTVPNRRNNRRRAVMRDTWDTRDTASQTASEQNRGLSQMPRMSQLTESRKYCR
jgi:hypothetical protein